MQAKTCWSAAQTMCMALVSAAEQAQPLLPGLDVAGLARRLSDAQQALLDKLGQVELRTDHPSEPTDEAAQLCERLVQPALALAELAQQAWQATGLAEAARLEVAQAAATRSCAYLACANLGAEGATEAGEGGGSKKCSGCRVAWYCSEACQYADWKVGHKRMCKALAAARMADSR
jgi:hypothetical protein